MLPGFAAFVGTFPESLAYFSFPFSSVISTVMGNKALNAAAVALSSSTAMKFFEPILIFTCLLLSTGVRVCADARGTRTTAQITATASAVTRFCFEGILTPSPDSSRAKQRLDRASLVHRSIALRHLLQRQHQVEYLSGVDLAVQDQFDQLGQVAAHGSGAAVQVNMAKEELCPVKAHSVRNAHVGHEP